MCATRGHDGIVYSVSRTDVGGRNLTSSGGEIERCEVFDVVGQPTVVGGGMPLMPS